MADNEVLFWIVSSVFWFATGLFTGKVLHRIGDGS